MQLHEGWHWAESSAAFVACLPACLLLLLLPQ